MYFVRAAGEPITAEDEALYREQYSKILDDSGFESFGYRPGLNAGDDRKFLGSDNTCMSIDPESIEITVRLSEDDDGFARALEEADLEVNRPGFNGQVGV